MNFSFEKAFEIISGKIESWLETLTAMLPNVVVAVLLLIVFYLLAKGVRGVGNKILYRLSDKTAVNSLFSTVLYLLTFGIGLLVSFNVLQLTQTASSLLAGAGIIGLALGFAFQDITANFISGIFMAFRRPIEVGDIIESQDYLGEVEKTDLRVTMIRTFQGLYVIIPNKEVFQQPFTNYTKTLERRVDLSKYWCFLC